MDKRNLDKTLWSILCMVTVVAVIVLSFIYRNTIEEYSALSYFGVFIACIASTATIFLPAPGLLVVLRYAHIFNPIVVILIGGIGAAIGEMVGYLFGWSGNAMLNIDKSSKVFTWFTSHPNTMVFVFSMIPLPVFDFIGICAGATNMNPLRFFGICTMGKTIKMALFVVVFYHIIPRIPMFQNLFIY